MSPVAEFCGQVLAERPSELLRGFIVTRGGRYAGVGSALSLLQATRAANRAQADEMMALAGTLNLARLARPGGPDRQVAVPGGDEP